MYRHLLRSVDGAIGTITLNRPEKRNALSLELMRELIQCLDEFGRDHGVRALILAANGKVFSSGHDLCEMVDRSVVDYRETFQVCTELMTELQSVPQPVIAQVHGVATAAGCQLVASCDLAIASEDAGFATPGVNIGLFCTTPMVALTRAVGRKRAMEMLLTGKLIDAFTAADWGSSTASCPPRNWNRKRGGWPKRSLRRANSLSRWASARSTSRSISISRKPTPTRKRS